MRNERFSPESAAEFDYEKSVRKSEDKFVWKYLQINKYLNRPAASLLVRAVFRTRVTPNQLTYAAFVIGLAGSYFLFRGRGAALVAGGGRVFALTTEAQCAWTVTSSAQWLSANVTEGTGSATILFTAARPTGNASRTATLAVGSAVFTVTLESAKGPKAPRNLKITIVK